MSTRNVNIAICIATYKRVDWLIELLNSLITQKLDTNIIIKIIIIDNDPEKSAESSVELFFSDKDINYVYDMQPEKNIALTRNKALFYAQESDYIALVDDDEWVTQEWLQNLLSTSQRFNADVVFGPAIPVLPETVPDWLIKGDFFSAGKRLITGSPQQHGASNNTLIHNSKFKSELKFAPEYGLTGGEDTELFHRLYLIGAKLVWCDEAVVYEHVTENRLNIIWLSKRSLRSGQINALIFYKNKTFVIALSQILKHISLLIATILIFPFALLFGKATWVRVLRKIMNNFGYLSMLMGNYAYQEYK